MDVFLNGQRVTLLDADLLGTGGEARVFRFGALALKVFHPVDPALPKKERTLARRLLQLKVEKLKAFPPGLPPAVAAPVQMLSDEKRNIVGYAMPRVDGAEDLLRLGQRSFREGAVSNDEVVALFRTLHALVSELHARRVVIGDFNDCNVLFGPRGPHLIDADSMQFGPYPCAVGHERFLDPRLYGLDLAAAPLFTPGSDWYAFAVQLFGSLLYVHPFGGTHPKLPTLLRRAEARHSVLRPDVRYPRGAVHWRVLPEPLLGYLEDVFERDGRAPLPSALLGLTWTRCTCGTEHARPSCPDCAVRAPAQVRTTTLHSGRCRAQVLLETTGRVLAAAMQGSLRFLFEEDGKLYREDRTEVPVPSGSRTARYALSGATTWAADGQQVLALRAGKQLSRSQADLFGSSAAFDAHPGGAVLVQGNWLVTSNGVRLGQVLGGQTWFRCGDRLGFGFFRAGLCTFFFLTRDHKPGLREVKLPPLAGRLIDAACVFDDRHALFSVATENAGVRTHASYLIDESGAVIGRRQGAPDTDRAVASIRGKALLGGRLLTLTDDGLLALTVDPATGRIEEGPLFGDTREFVSVDAQLFAAPGGAAIVVAPRRITQLSLAA